MRGLRQSRQSRQGTTKRSRSRAPPRALPGRAGEDGELGPAALELSLAAAEHLEEERADLGRLWQQRGERVAYEADRAARQGHACEPEHRLVARALERQWEAKPAAQQEVEEPYHRFLRQQPRPLSAAERAAIRRLAANIPALWTAPTTDADRKERARQVAHRVEVATEGRSERLRGTVHRTGGGQTGDGLPAAPPADRLSTYAALSERERALTAAGLAAPAVAERLHAEGFRPVRGARFGRTTVREVKQRLGLIWHRPDPRPCDGLAPDEGGAPTWPRRWGSPCAR